MKSATAIFLLGSLSLVYSFINFNIRGNAPWFQALNNNNRIRDTFMLGVVRGKNSACMATGTTQMGTQGVCKPPKECKKQGGTGSGTCALVGVCCVIANTCGNTTRSKVSYFNSPTTFQTECSLNIQLYSPNVCQIRLDFERFHIEGPPAEEGMGKVANCDFDSFMVNGVGNLGFESLCGNNTGQHIYIPVNASTANFIMLEFQLQDDRGDFFIMNPDWRIKITQLECGMSNKDFTSVQSALTFMYQKHKNKKNSAKDDQSLLAPPGCLQYYPNPSGTYESFNFNRTKGRMLANLDYAICFNRKTSTCGIRHTAEYLAIPENCNDEDNSTSCRTPSQNWLLIPGGNSGTEGDYYCGISLLFNNTVTSYSSGPLYVGVKTDNLVNQLGQYLDSTAFRVSYNTLNSCPGGTPAGTPVG